MSGSRVKRYRGVRQRQWGSWVSEIRHSISKTRVWLGTFETAKEAAKAYDEAARLMEGAGKAKTNFSSSSSSSSPSLLSPAVKAKLQRCNCLATLQGSASSRDKSGPPHSFHLKSLSLPPSSSSASSSRAHYAIPPPPPGPSTSSSSSKAPRRHGSSAPMVCLRLDNSHEQLGVTWQASSSSTSTSPTSSSSLWFTALPLPAPAPAPSRQISPPPANVSTQLTAPAAQQADHLTSLVLPQPSHPHTSIPVSTHLATLQANSASYSRHLMNSNQLCHINPSFTQAAPRQTSSPLCHVSSTAEQLSRHMSTESYSHLGASHVRQVSGLQADSADLLQAALQMGLANSVAQYEEEAVATEAEVPLNLELAMEQTMMLQEQGNAAAAAGMTYGSNTNTEGSYSSGSTESSEVEYTNTSSSTGSQYGQSDGLSSLTAALWYLEQEEEMAGAGTTSGNGYVLEEHEGSNARYEPVNFMCSYLPLYAESCQELYEQQLWQ